MRKTAKTMPPSKEPKLIDIFASGTTKGVVPSTTAQQNEAQAALNSQIAEDKDHDQDNYSPRP